MRKKDYIIFYVLHLIFFGINLWRPGVGEILNLAIVSILPALILGTLTNVLTLIIKALRIFIRKNS